MLAERGRPASYGPTSRRRAHFASLHSHRRELPCPKSSPLTGHFADCASIRSLGFTRRATVADTNRSFAQLPPPCWKPCSSSAFASGNRGRPPLAPGRRQCLRFLDQAAELAAQKPLDASGIRPSIDLRCALDERPTPGAGSPALQSPLAWLYRRRLASTTFRPKVKDQRKSLIWRQSELVSKDKILHYVEPSGAALNRRETLLRPAKGLRKGDLG
jgi:hypothetical protein